MEIKIGKPLSIQSPKDKYKINIEFMFGDADGTDYEEILVDGNKFNTSVQYNKEVELLIETLQKCIKLDRKGRRGYDSFEEVLKDHYKNKNLEKFLEYPEKENQTKYKELLFNIPSREEWLDSFRGLTITYFNKDGIEHETTY